MADYFEIDCDSPYMLRKKWWLLPILFVMQLVSALLVFAQGSALAPFIYTIF